VAERLHYNGVFRDHAERKSLLDLGTVVRSVLFAKRHRMSVVTTEGKSVDALPMIGLAAVVALENVPQPQSSITSQVQLAAGDTTDRHAHPSQFVLPALQNFGSLPGGERRAPAGIELLVAGDQILEGGTAYELDGASLAEMRQTQGGGTRACQLQQLASIERRIAALGSIAATTARFHVILRGKIVKTLWYMQR
jgi:hypothetical protein